MNIELPPLPAELRKEFVRRTSYISEADRDTRAAFVDEIARAAIEADRQRRGEPAFYVNARIFDPATGKIKTDVNGALTWSERPAGNWQVPVYTAPQPAASAEPWDGHKFKRHADGTWRCADGCGPVLVERRAVMHWPDGTPRDERDIASDPEGTLIHNPSEPLRATSEEPSGYAYRYPDGGIRFSNGGEINGSKPTEAIPYWFAAQQPISTAYRLLAAICDAFHIGSAARTPETVMANVENAIRRSRCLGAIERVLVVETPPDPDEGDDEPGEEELLRWGAEPDGYEYHFKSALSEWLAAQPQPSGNADRQTFHAMESALSELVDKIIPGLDTGDLLTDAIAASKALDAKPSGNAEPCRTATADAIATATAQADSQHIQALRAEVERLKAALAAQASGEEAEDPFQPVANWLVNDAGIGVHALAGKLMIGINRAQRLVDAARAAAKEQS